MRKHLFVTLGVLVFLSMVLSACGTPTPAPVATSVPPVAGETAVPTAVPPTVMPTAAPVAGKVQIYWYIGLGSGAQPLQIQAEKDFVQKYNDGQGAKDGIQLIMIVVDNKYAIDNLTAQIAAGNAPDIVGPVGTEGRAAFPSSNWADLTPLMSQIGYDVSKIDPAMLGAFKQDGKQVGIPFGVFPSAIFYNKDLFDAAGLKYPPSKIGDKYNLNGQDVDWTFDTVAQVAKLLTLDNKGKNATEAGFDAKHITQYGFDFQWTVDNPMWYANYFEPTYPIKDGKAYVSDGTRLGIKWFYDAMWGKQPFMPNGAARGSDLMAKGNPFNSGKLAMGLVNTWYTCCITPKLDDKGNPNKDFMVANWDLGIVPISPVDNKIHARLNSDVFLVMAASKHPAEAAKAYAYMVGEGGGDLALIYGAVPLDKTKQPGFFESLDKKFAPTKVNWQVSLDMLTVVAAYDSQMQLPNNNKSVTDWKTFGSDLNSKGGLDVDKRIDQFIADWNKDLAAA